MIYWWETKKETSFYVCKASRYEVVWHHSVYDDTDAEETDSTSKNKKTPPRFFVIFHIPRWQRLFMPPKIDLYMRWHHDHKDNYVLSHPVSPVWRLLVSNMHLLVLNQRNIWLGLAINGFNTYRTMSIKQSTWSVVLVRYLSPSICSNQAYTIVSTHS